MGLMEWLQGQQDQAQPSGNLAQVIRKYGVASFAALPPAVQMMLQAGAPDTQEAH